MRITRYLIAAILALFLDLSLGLPSAQATLIDNGTFTTDTTTGLDWLDVTQTTGQSYNTVVSEFGSTLAGWSYASLAEVSTLFTDAGAIGPYDFTVGGPNGTSVNDTAAQLLADLLGGTGTFGANSGQGLIANPDGFGDRYLSTYWDGGGFSYLLDCDCFESQADSLGSSTVGSFLVRTSVARTSASAEVPEPTSMALLAAGLTGLGFIRRRKRA